MNEREDTGRVREKEVVRRNETEVPEKKRRGSKWSKKMDE